MSMTIRQRSAALQRFTGGLNNYWDQSSIADNELADIVNFEFSTNGALSSRPPIYTEKSSGGATIVTPVAGEAIDLIGTYVQNNGTRYIVVTTASKTWLYSITAKTFTQIATFKASDCAQYDNKLVLCSTTVSGGYWDGTVFTATATMPLLGGIELFQNRFFGYGVQGTTTANTIYWSDITTFGPSGQLTSIYSWKDSVTNNYYYVEIGTGDGQWITAIARGYNDLVIFRNQSTYRYSYGDTPALGTMQAMQQDIGAENKWSVVKFENAHFVMSGGILYRYQNWIYYPLNAQRVDMQPSPDATNRFEHAVSVIGRRILVSHGGYLYCYNMDTDTWARWTTTTNIAYFIGLPRSSEDRAEMAFYGVSFKTTAAASNVSDFAIFRIEDNPFSIVGSEVMSCKLKTKIYDFDSPVEWKRLYFWSADVQSALPVKAIVYPVVLSEAAVTASWDELSQNDNYDYIYKTWDDLSKDVALDATYGTWDKIADATGAIESTIQNFATTKPVRAELKLNQALRFRRIYFELYLNCDGTASTSPAQIFSIIPMIGAKAKIAKAAN